MVSDQSTSTTNHVVYGRVRDESTSPTNKEVRGMVSGQSNSLTNSKASGIARNRSSSSTNSNARSGQPVTVSPNPTCFANSSIIRNFSGFLINNYRDAPGVDTAASDTSSSTLPFLRMPFTNSGCIILRDRNASPTSNEHVPGVSSSASVAFSSVCTIRRDRSISPTNNGNMLRMNAPASEPAAADASTQNTTLCFHRKSHHERHEHQQSVTPGPFTCTKTRKYKLLHIPDKPLTHTHAESDISDLADNLQALALRRPNSPWVYSPANVRKALRQWSRDEDWMSNAVRLEAKNRFRGIEMNQGNNRESACLLNFMNDLPSSAPHFEGGPEMRMKIRESLNRFSLWAQLEPVKWDAEELKGMFDVVFVGEGLGNSGWARKPGSWWAQRKKLFDGHKGRTFLEELHLWVGEIEDGREKWKRENKGKLFEIGSLKRKRTSAKREVDVEGDMRRKMVNMPKTKSEQVMSEEWRARRRLQEKKAGRWTDGTCRMDQMWAEFHWVLNEDDPRDFRNYWPREVFKRAYYY